MFENEKHEGETMKKLIALVTMLLAILAMGCTRNVSDQKDQGQIAISSFEDCVGAGYPVMEIYPAQCKTPDGKIFIQEADTQLTEREWKTDDVALKRIPESGELACFGCGATMCVDPISGLEEVEETPEQHCDQDFKIVSSE